MVTLLTRRQRQVLRLAVLSNKEIAHELGISTRRIKEHLTNLYARFLEHDNNGWLGDCKRVRLLLILLWLGLVRLDELHPGRLRQGEENDWCW